MCKYQILTQFKGPDKNTSYFSYPILSSSRSISIKTKILHSFSLLYSIPLVSNTSLHQYFLWSRAASLWNPGNTESFLPKTLSLDLECTSFYCLFTCPVSVPLLPLILSVSLDLILSGHVY